MRNGCPGIAVRVTAKRRDLLCTGCRSLAPFRFAGRPDQGRRQVDVVPDSLQVLKRSPPEPVYDVWIRASLAQNVRKLRTIRDHRTRHKRYLLNRIAIGAAFRYSVLSQLLNFFPWRHKLGTAVKVPTARQPDRVARLMASFRNGDHGATGPLVDLFYPEFDRIAAAFAGTLGL